MSSLTVRINEKSHKALRELAAETGQSMQSVLAKAIEEYRRKRFWEEVNAGYAALRSDPKAWKEELEERALFEGTLMDGLEDD
jgi:predicted transcriptional regulator